MPSKKGNCWEQAIALTTWRGWPRFWADDRFFHHQIREELPTIRSEPARRWC